MNDIKKKWYENINGGASSKRLIATYGCIIGYAVAITIVIYGLGHSISSPSVVTDITISIVGAPFLTLISTVFEKSRGKKYANNDME